MRAAIVEDILGKNPGVNVRRPKVNYESRTLELDRNELGALLIQAGLRDLRDGALIMLLALNGLRIPVGIRPQAVLHQLGPLPANVGLPRSATHCST